MNVNESFTYQFRDLQWPKKLGLGALISLVPILNLALGGYMVQIVRNVASGAAQPLPEWDELERKFRDGLILAVAMLVYAAPVLILLCLPLAILLLSGGLSQNDSTQGLARALGAAGQVGLLCFIGLLFLYSIALSIIRPMITVIFARDGTLASCFRFGEIRDILTRHTGPLFTTWLVIILAGFLVGLGVGFINVVVGWVPCLGWLAALVLGLGATVYLLTVDAHVLGQFRSAALGPSGNITESKAT